MHVAGGGGLWEGVGACDKSCGHIAGEWGRDMWQGWGHVAGVGVGACQMVWEHVAGGGGI